MGETEIIDLSSDTKTRPTPVMRETMARAEVGDDHFGEDPTVRALIEKGASILRKDAAIFLPSATMANQIAIRVHCATGDEVILHEHAHIRLYESAGPAVFSGVLLASIPGPRGVFTGEQVEAAIRPKGPYYPPTSLVCVENTHNHAGGCVWSADEIDDVARVCRANALALHCDGSRLFNAAVSIARASERATFDVVAELAAPCDTVTLCLTKGLGAPIGALLVGSKETIEKARRWKHAFGGAMRQSGIVAAAGILALDNHVERLHDDHLRAEKLAEGLQQICGVRLDPWPETNLVFVDTSQTGLSGDTISTRLLENGIRVSGGGNRLRLVTHLDIDDRQIDRAVQVFAEIVERG